MAEYSRDQIYEAMRRADAAGDGEAVKKLAAALQGGASKGEILDIAKQNNLTVDEKALDANITSRDRGGPVNTFMPPKAPTLAESVVSALAGVAQGAAGVYDFPVSVASGVNRGVQYALGEGGGVVLDAVGFESAADWLRGASRGARSALANQPTVAGAIESAFPTPQGLETPRFVAQLGGALAVPFPKGAPRVTAPRAALAPSEAVQTVAAGEREGVRVLTSDVAPPKRFLTKMVQATGERIPYAGTGGQRAAQQAERVQAVRNIAQEFGATDDAVAAVAKDLAKTRGAKIEKLTSQKNAVISGIADTFDEAPRTVQAIGEQVRRLQGIDAEAFAPVIERLQKFGRELTSGKTLEQVEGQRKLLGDLFSDTSLAAIKGDGQKAINAIYTPLRDDMGAFIKAKAGNAAHSRWRNANAELSNMVGDLGNSGFKRVLNNAESTPEDVARLLFSKKPSEVRRLFGNLSDAGKAKARAAIIHEAVTKAGTETSPKLFANAIGKLHSSIGVAFTREDATRIEGLKKLLDATQRASEASAAPPTGVQNTVPVMAAILTDFMGTAGGALTSAGLAGLAARAYESAPVRNLLVGLGRAKTAKQEGVMVERIGKILVSQGELKAANNNDFLATAISRSPERAAAQDENNRR